MDHQALSLLDGLPDDYEHWDEKLLEMPHGDGPVLYAPSLRGPNG